MRAIPFIFLCFCFGISFGQSRFSVEDTARYISGTTNTGVLHHYIQAHNLVGDTLHMRWRKKVIGNPPAWRVNFADPQQNRPDISNIDSADFVLPDSSHWTYNKFVIGINPLGLTGTGTWVFTVFEQGRPSDSVRLYFEVWVYSNMNEQEISKLPAAYPNPAGNFIKLRDWDKLPQQLLFVNEQGKLFPVEAQASGDEALLEVKHLPKGVYTLMLNQKAKLQVIKILIE